MKTVTAKSPANPHRRPHPTRENFQNPLPVAEVGLSHYRKQPVTLILDSSGGDIFSAIKIAESIRQHGKVTCICHRAWSAATIIAAACRRVEMAKDGRGALLHVPRATMIDSTATQLRAEAQRCDDAIKVWINALAHRIAPNLAKKFFEDDSDKELTPSQCVKIGLADMVVSNPLPVTPLPADASPDAGLAMLLIQALNRLALKPDEIELLKKILLPPLPGSSGKPSADHGSATATAPAP